MTKSRKKNRGTTLIELLTATSISVLVLGGCVSLLYAGSVSWAQGLGQVGAESDAQMAVRTICERLSEAMSVSVAANGQSVSYELPQQDSSGNDILPLQWDGVSRSFAISGSQLLMIDGAQQHTIANGVILTDPSSPGGNTAYKLFVAGPGAITQQVTVEVATRWNGFEARKVASRDRETIFCRNVQIPTF